MAQESQNANAGTDANNKHSAVLLFVIGWGAWIHHEAKENMKHETCSRVSLQSILHAGWNRVPLHGMGTAPQSSDVFLARRCAHASFRVRPWRWLPPAGDRVSTPTVWREPIGWETAVGCTFTGVTIETSEGIWRAQLESMRRGERMCHLRRPG